MGRANPLVTYTKRPKSLIQWGWRGVALRAPGVATAVGRPISDQSLRPGSDLMLEHACIGEEHLKLALPEQVDILPLALRIPTYRIAPAQVALCRFWHELVQRQLVVQPDRKPLPRGRDEVSSSHAPN